MGEGLEIVFLGTAQFAVPTLRALAGGPDTVAAVFTRPDRPAGRGRRLRPPPVKVAAQELGLPLHQPDRVGGSRGLERLRALSPDLVFVAAYGEILSEEVISLPRLGALNLHASLLPRYRGAAPIQRALLAGESTTGVTVQWMVRELDAGDILFQREIAIGLSEDFGSLHDRLAALGAESAAEAVALVRQGAAPRVPQKHEQATLAPPIARGELTVDWARPAAALVRLVRALSPRPGARTTRRGELLKVLSAEEGKNVGEEKGIPGRVTEVTKDGFSVESGSGSLRVRRVQPAGRKVMSAGDYVKGYRLRPGEVLGTECKCGEG